MFSSLKRPEKLTLVMVVISAIASLLYHGIPREVTISPATGWHTESVSDGTDGSVGGRSTSRASPNNGGFEFDFNILEGSNHRFSSMLIHAPGGESTLDLSWYETVTLTAYLKGKDAGYFRFRFRNQDESVYDPDDLVSAKYNTVLFKLNSEPQTLVLSKDNFYVPEWWIERMSVSLDEARPRFDRVALVELTTGPEPSLGPGSVVIDNVKLSGHWISPGLFYSSMMFMWMTIASIYAVCAIFGLSKRLDQSETMELKLQRKTAELTQQATLDPLTQLYNRRGMREHVSEALQDLEHSNQVFSLILFDIDDFKKLNDEHGHGRGDEVLREVAAIASDTLTAQEPIARWGGEEFLVLCKTCDSVTAAGLAHKLRSRFESELSVTCSFGVCEGSPHVEFPVTLDMADHYLYLAKRSGKNCVQVMAEEAKASTKTPNRPAIEA